MIWRDLPPAGNPILVDARSGDAPIFAGCRAVWVNSGTAALSLAMSVARARHPQIALPEVVLPGYACPDLVTAAVHAGLSPVLADIGASDPGYDVEALEHALSERTVAVVAVNFLGIRERLPRLRQLLAERPILLIEDNAQWFPEQPIDETSGDALVLSFGRGKPVSLLGGGALLLRESFADAIAQLPIGPALQPGPSLQWKMRAYNLLLQPHLYGLISRNPMLKLGETAYKALPAITALDATRLALLSRNVAEHLRRPQMAAEQIDSLLPAAMNLPAQVSERRGRLLRYPVVCADRSQRDDLRQRLTQAGLGCTAMYRRPLPEIEGVAGRVKISGALPGADTFADRLLTLPTHCGVDDRSLARMAEIFRGAR